MSIAEIQLSPQVGYADPTLVVACPFSSPLTAGSTVLVYITQYLGAAVFSVVVDGVAAVLDCAAVNIPDAASQTVVYRAANVPGLTPDVTVTLLGAQPYGTVRAQEFSGVGAIVFAQTGGQAEPAITYPALPETGCLAIALSLDMSDGGPTHWVPPAGYALGLNIAEYTNSSSGASAWQVLALATGATVTWGTLPGPQGSQGLVIYQPAPAATPRNTFFGASP